MLKLLKNTLYVFTVLNSGHLQHYEVDIYLAWAIHDVIHGVQGGLQ